MTADARQSAWFREFSDPRGVDLWALFCVFCSGGLPPPDPPPNSWGLPHPSPNRGGPLGGPPGVLTTSKTI